MRDHRPLLAYFGHHKCASTWIHRILAEFARQAGLRHAYLHNAGQFGGDLGAYVERHRLDLVSYVNADVDRLEGLPPFRGFHVVRDPRDLVVSAYFSHLGTHATEGWPALAEHRARLRELPKEEGLRLEMEFSAPILDDLRRWDYGRPDVLELRQEELTRSPYGAFLEVFDFLGALDAGEYGRRARLAHELRSAWNAVAARPRIPLPRFPVRCFPVERLLGIVHDHRFTKLAGGRSRGEEDRRSHYRSGLPGDWRNHFDHDLLREFKDRFGDVVLKLGYETDPDWGPASPR